MFAVHDDSFTTQPTSEERDGGFTIQIDWQYMGAMLQAIRNRVVVRTLDDIVDDMQAVHPHLPLPSFRLSRHRETYQNTSGETSMGRGTEYGNNVDWQTGKTLNQVAQILHYRNHPLIAEHAIASMFDGIPGIHIRK